MRRLKILIITWADTNVTNEGVLNKRLLENAEKSTKNLYKKLKAR